ncbi:MAG: ferrous iron transport protein B [Fimbriimonadaceae bacterium]|nr:ferrous iron transport protein B [Fimbriimonadaceae bacterium]QYK59353.1 MAG: ferrous iron transport protein B [Fimbriimonadaceae bacterium]
MAKTKPAPTSTACVALVGNPNSGKTTLFNALTGMSQKVGNYPGVTVEKVTGTYSHQGLRYEVVDVPGLYSMRPVSLDEELAARAMAGTEGRPPDVIVFVLDASNLERNLFLFSQTLAAGLPTVVALTMTDMLARERSGIDVAALEARLGVPVVNVVAHRKQGLSELQDAVARAIVERTVPDIDLGFPTVVREAVFRLHDALARAGIDANRSEVRETLLNPESAWNRKLEGNPDIVRAFQEERQLVLGESIQGRTVDAQTRYAWAAKVRRAVLQSSDSRVRAVSDAIDRVLTHRFFGLVIFFGLMYLVFQSIYTFASPIMGWIENGIQSVQSAVSPALAGAPLLQSLVVDGVLAGIGAVVVFLPQIAILFCFIGILEGTGYLARAAFLMDRILGWCGLNGRAFIPLLSSFACAVPGIMAARVMPDSRSRMATALVAPFMSCSARLPVYVLLIGAFVEPQFGPAVAGAVLFVMHFVGLAVAVPMVWILNRSVFKTKRLPFVLELPRYQWPRWRDVALTVTTRVKVFLQTAGTIIFVMSIVIWALLSFPKSEAMDSQYQAAYQSQPDSFKEARTEENYVQAQRVRDSYLGQFGRAIEPAFVPAGFDWRITTAVLAAFPAREVVVSALGIIFSLGGDADEESSDLRSALAQAKWPDGRPLLTLASAASLMVFFALCAQCLATLATIKRETGSWKWAAFSFVSMTTLAYIAAVIVYQVGIRLV